jgi:hypothetical protein
MNTVGIFNTQREKAFYRIIAHLGGIQHTFNTPDWKAVTQTIWRLKDDDLLMKPNQQFNPFSSIVY